MLHDLAVMGQTRRSGVGRQLIEFVAARYPDRLLFGDTVESALGFYRALGFEIREQGVLPSGEVMYRFSLPESAKRA